MTIEAIVFDFGRVICDFDIGLFIARAARRSSKTEMELQDVMASSMPVAQRYESGLITSDEFYDEIRRRAALSMTKDEFVWAYTDIFTPKVSTLELVRRLKPVYRLALLSNTSQWHFTYGIRPVAVFSLFEAVTLSYEVGAMKPDRRIYEDVLGKLRLPAERCAYIDDIAEYVEAGRRLGFRAIHYTTHEKLMNDLEAAGVTLPVQSGTGGRTGI